MQSNARNCDPGSNSARNYISSSKFKNEYVSYFFLKLQNKYRKINLPSQNSVTSARLSDLNKLLNDVAKLLPKLFHFRQNCCCCESISKPVLIMLLAATKETK